MKKCYLAFEIGTMQKTIYPLVGPTTIGRAADNIITLPDPMASRNHAEVILKDGTWIVEDLGSANGIVVDGQRLDRVILNTGVVFQIGGSVFRFIEKESPGEGEQLFETVEILVATNEEVAAEVTEEEKKEETRSWSQRLQDAVAAIPFFYPLEEEARKELADSANLHVFNGGETIIREGDPGRSIYVILDGQVRVFTRDNKGEDLELALLEASQFFGEMSFLTGKPRSGSVAALDTSVIVELGYTSMRKVVKGHPEVKKVLLEFYHERMGSTEKKRAEAGMEERRAEPRTKDKVPVKLIILPQTTPTAEVEASSWDAFSVDISESGIVVGVSGASQSAFQVEGEVRLEIEIPEPWGEVRTLGTIRRVKPALTDKKLILLGIEYVGIAEADAKNLKNFLHGEDHF